MNIETQGDFAYYDGQELFNNPYEEDSDEYKRWKVGWLVAQQNSKRESKYIREDYNV